MSQRQIAQHLGVDQAYFSRMTGVLGIQFEAGVNFVDLYENDPGGEGVLTDSTTGQFTDNTIFWIERFRWITSSDSFQIHRGGVDGQCWHVSRRACRCVDAVHP